MNTVLVVDASADVRSFLRRALTHKNPTAHVLEAISVADARRVLQTWQVCCIMTNYMLPDGSALDILALLGSISRSVPVIGMSSADVADVMLAAGATAFIRKPFSLIELSEALQRAAYQPHLIACIASR